jgi:hypothetical protein
VGDKLFYNGTDEPCSGSCTIEVPHYNRWGYLIAFEACGGGCHLAKGHEGPCVCGDKSHRDRRLAQMAQG